MNFICFNGELKPENEPVFTIQNRGFKYGDGVFETIKVWKGDMPFANLHFERLFSSLKLLKIHHGLTQVLLTNLIIELCKKNGCDHLGRVRLAVYRNENNAAGFVIEAIALHEESNGWNEKGLIIDLYPYARKSKDAFANLKSANFLPYVLAGIFASENNLDDSILLNADHHICDTSKANIFLVKNHQLFTPALHQGCVNGVMRRFLIDHCKLLGFKVHQQEITNEDLTNAEEVFLTNAIYGMRWVRSFRDRNYANAITASIYRQLVATIYQ